MLSSNPKPVVSLTDSESNESVLRSQSQKYEGQTSACRIDDMGNSDLTAAAADAAVRGHVAPRHLAQRSGARAPGGR